MARIRCISPDLWAWPGLRGVGIDARYLLFGLISHADDHGRLSGDLEWIRAKVYPFKSRGRPTEARIAAMLGELATKGVITRYRAETVPTAIVDAIGIIGWFDGATPLYQVIQRPQEPKFPAPPNGQGRIAPKRPPKSPPKNGRKPAKRRVSSR